MPGLPDPLQHPQAAPQSARPGEVEVTGGRRERLRAALPAAGRILRRIEVLAACASTSDELRRRLSGDEAAAANGLVLVARTQTGGRGRRARDWWSGPPDTNLHLSLALPPPEPAEAGGLLAACAAAAAAEAAARRPAALKWPNDVLIAGRKVGGILSELPAASVCLVIGIGLNVGAAPPAAAAAAPAACLAEFAGRPLDPAAVLADLLAGLEERWCDYLDRGPDRLEEEFLLRLRRWAPFGVEAPDRPDLPRGPLLEFSVRRGLSWGGNEFRTTLAAGRLPALRPLPPPAAPGAAP
ncbi:MAG: biotin--[acetyl-CoA-carboxylase] ligase [Planctomycetota bacterium]|nr:MAG: biotin--[acetyl-CoA-carboxylase] ligase [Planctomycetota bacterium]